MPYTATNRFYETNIQFIIADEKAAKGIFVVSDLSGINVAYVLQSAGISATKKNEARNLYDVEVPLNELDRALDALLSEAESLNRGGLRNFITEAKKDLHANVSF